MKTINKVIGLAIVVCIFISTLHVKSVYAFESIDTPEVVTGSTIEIEILDNEQDNFTENTDELKEVIEQLLKDNVESENEVLHEQVDEPVVDDMDSNIDIGMNIDVSIEQTIVDICIPMNVSVYINPNEPNGFMYGAIEVVNNTNAPVELGIKSSIAYNAPFNNFIEPYELPTHLDWDNMSLSQTKEYFSIGIKPVNTAEKRWRSILTENYVYMCGTDTKVTLGTIHANESVYLGMKSYYGKSFKHATNFQINVVFVAELIS